MTHKTDNTNQDRGIWEQYKRAWPESLRAVGNIEPDGEDANQIAAFLDNRLNKRERRAIEQRLAHEPAFREALMSAHALLQGGEVPEETPPASLVAWAQNMKPMTVGETPDRKATRLPRAGESGASGSRPKLGLRPAMGFAFGMALMGIVAGYGIYRMVDTGGNATVVAKKKSPEDKRRAGAKDPDDRDNNSIFSSDPDFIFDGLDVDPPK